MASETTVLARTSQPEALRLTNATVVDTRTGKLSPGMNIVFEGGHIRSIRPTSSDAASTLRSVDATGKFVVPGFLDMHVHSVEQAEPQHNLSTLLSYGVTGIRQMAGTPALLEKRKHGKLDFGLSAPELLAMPGAILTAGNAATPEQGVEEVRSQKRQGADFIKTISVSPKTFFATLAEAKSLSLPYGGHMSPGVDIAKASEQGMSFIEHLGGPFEMLLIKCSKAEFVISTMMTLRPPKPMKLTEAEVNSLTGKLIIANPILFLLNMNPNALDRSQKLISSFSEAKGRKIADTFARNQTWQCPTLIRGETMRFADEPRFADSPDARYLSASMRAVYTGFSQQYAQKLTPTSRDTLKQHKALALRVVKMFDEAGVPMMAGSDYGGGWVIPGVSLHQEFDLLEEAGLSALRVLQMATLDGARFLHRESTLGTVEEGKHANLVILEADPLQSVQNLHKIAAVVRGGQYYPQAQLLTLRDQVATELAAV